MKKDLTQLVLSVAFALLGSSLEAQPSIVDSILNLHFQRVGGKDAWQSINSYVLTQSGYQISFSPRSITDYGQKEKVKESPKITYYQYPDNYRTEYFTDGQKDFIGLITASETTLYFLSGDVEFGSGMILPKEAHLDLLSSQPFHTIGPTHAFLLAMADKEMEYKGLVEAYGKVCHQIMVSGKSFKHTTNLYFDAQSYLIHAISNVDPPQFYKLYADYRKVGGLMIPYSNTGYKEGKLIERSTTIEIKINQELDSNIFLDK